MVLRTHIRKQTKSSAEVIALIPTLAPLPFCIHLRITDYYAFDTGFAAYIFIDREHHVNGCWSGIGEGKGVFRGRQTTVDGRAVIDGEWVLGRDGIVVVPSRPVGGKARSRRKSKHEKRKEDRVTTIEVVVLRTEKRIENNDDADASESSSEADIEIVRGDTMTDNASHLGNMNSPASGCDIPYAYSWRNPPDGRSNDNLHHSSRTKKDRRIREFERAIKKPSISYTRRPYSSSSNSASSRATSRDRLVLGDVDELRTQLSALLSSDAGHKGQGTSYVNDSNRSSPNRHVSPVTAADFDQTFGRNDVDRDTTIHETKFSTELREEVKNKDQPGDTSAARDGARHQSQVPRSSHRFSSSESATSSDDETSSSSCSERSKEHCSDQPTSQSNSDHTSSTYSNAQSDSESSDSDGFKPTKKSKKRTKPRHRKPHPLYRKYWHYRDRNRRSHSFGGRHVRPSYQARHRITPVFLDTMERPYAIFKFRIASAETLQSARFGMSVEEVDKLRLRSREQSAVLDALDTEQLRALVRNCCVARSDGAPETDTRDNERQGRRERKREERRSKERKSGGQTSRPVDVSQQSGHGSKPAETGQADTSGEMETKKKNEEPVQADIWGETANAGVDNEGW